MLLVTGSCAGGIRRTLLDLVAGLPARGWEPLLAAPPGIDRLPPDLPLAPGSGPASVLRWAAALGLASGRLRPAIVHAHGLKAAVACLLLPRRLPAPVVVTLHNLARRGPESALFRPLLRRATAVTCVSDAVARSHKLSTWAKTPPGVDLERFRPAPTCEGPPAALFAGRLTREKGADLLPTLASLLPADLPLSILVAGEGPLQGLLQAAATGCPRLQLVGRVERIEEACARAGFLIAPSRAEGFGLAALEAMACGLPVVAARVGGLAELVTDAKTGYLAAPGDPAGLARQMERLARLTFAERRRMGAAARAHAETFGLDTAIDRVRALYGHAIGGR